MALTEGQSVVLPQRSGAIEVAGGCHLDSIVGGAHVGQDDHVRRGSRSIEHEGEGGRVLGGDRDRRARPIGYESIRVRDVVYCVRVRRSLHYEVIEVSKSDGIVVGVLGLVGLVDFYWGLVKIRR